MSQLPLDVALDDEARFETFFEGPNALAVAALNELTSPGLWLYGPVGSGKSHLLQAVAHASDLAYRALGELPEAAMLEGAERPGGIALDDIDRIAGDPDWEERLFSLFNVVCENAAIVVSTTRAPANCGIRLPDLGSRLRALPTFALRPLDDDGRLQALALRAATRGLDVDTATLTYLLTHSRRGMDDLYAELAQLDRAALAAGRRLTIPFVRAFLRGELDASPAAT